jgi:hypothetical protein
MVEYTERRKTKRKKGKYFYSKIIRISLKENSYREKKD